MAQFGGGKNPPWARAGNHWSNYTTTHNAMHFTHLL